MAATVTKSEFWTRNAARIAPVVEAHRNDRPKVGFAPLPGGIKIGIAKVTFCGFGRNDNGEYFRCEAEVVAPKEVGGVPLTGMKTSRVVILQDTDIEASVVAVTDLLKLLGCEFPPGTTIDPAVIGAAITGANPPVCIRFSTRESPPAPNPKKPGEMYPARVWEDWHGVVPGYVPSTGTTAPAPSTNGNHTATANPAPWSEAKPTPIVTPTPDSTPKSFPLVTPPGNYADNEDLDPMGARASSESDVADRLRELAKGVGYSDAEIDDSDSWTTVVEWIKGGGKKAEPDENPRVPEKTDVVTYAPPDKKSSVAGARMKPVSCEVTDVQVRKGTVTLTRFDDRSKKYVGVPYAELVYAAE